MNALLRDVKSHTTLHECIATRQNHHDRGGLIGNHLLGPSCHSATPRPYLAQIGSTGRHRGREVFAVLSAKEEQKWDILLFLYPSLALLDETRHLPGYTPSLTSMADHLDVVPGKQKDGISQVVSSSLDGHLEGLKMQTVQSWQHCVGEHVDTCN